MNNSSLANKPTQFIVYFCLEKKPFMYKIFPLLLLLVISKDLQAQSISIIPQPVSLVEQKGSFVIDSKTSINFSKQAKGCKDAATFLSHALKEISGLSLPENAKGAQSIQLVIASKSELGKEGYQLKVSPSGILINANDRAGLVYGIQTLLQQLPAVRTNAALSVHCMEVTDYPRFKWRGMHLDVSRHFFSPDMIKEYLDLMARYKMNVFHWHLVDDQGWRIEIKKYPELNRISSWRVDKLDRVWGERPQATDGEIPTYGGYYTQAQVKEIVAYAAQRNITIVPEIEMPGHSASAIAAYPRLSCTNKSQKPMTGGNYKDIASNYCAGNDSVFHFVQDVLSEVIAIFPSAYIHVGGDEVDKDPWKKCSRCQARMKKEGLKDEAELQSYFMKRVEKFLEGKHRKMMGWDEILEGGLAPGAAVMSWRGEQGGIDAARMKHDVVMTPGTPCYFDHYQAGPEGEPIAIGGMNTLKRVYEYDPLPKELKPQEAAYIMGAQANLWTEYISANEQVEYMVLPRMLALAEVLWSKKESKDWQGFNERLQPQFRYFDQKGYHYCNGDFKADIKPIAKDGHLTAEMSTEQLGATICYTTDGSEPDAGSQKYEHPISVDSTMTINAITLIRGRVMSAKPSVQRFEMHKAVGHDVVYANPISKYYMADGNNSLTDGVRGNTDHHKYWHGICGKDLIATVDLGKPRTLHHLALGCLQVYKDWIFFPKKVRFEVSEDGVNYTPAGEAINSIPLTEPARLIRDFGVNIGKKKVRYIRVSASVADACPEGHPGAGQPAWLFADELVVE